MNKSVKRNLLRTLLLGVLFGALANPVAEHAAMATVVSAGLAAFAARGRLAAGFAWGAGMGFTLVILTFAINYFGKK